MGSYVSCSGNMAAQARGHLCVHVYMGLCSMLCAEGNTQHCTVLFGLATNNFVVRLYLEGWLDRNSCTEDGYRDQWGLCDVGLTTTCDPKMGTFMACQGTPLPVL